MATTNRKSQLEKRKEKLLDRLKKLNKREIGKRFVYQSKEDFEITDKFSRKIENERGKTYREKILTGEL